MMERLQKVMPLLVAALVLVGIVQTTLLIYTHAEARRAQQNAWQATYQANQATFHAQQARNAAIHLRSQQQLLQGQISSARLCRNR